MTRLHGIYFFFWKLKLYFLGIKKGTFVKTFSEDKSKFIKGVVTSLNGDSITSTKYSFDISVNWLEPLQGNDSRYYNVGHYTEKQVKEFQT